MALSKKRDFYKNSILKALNFINTIKDTNTEDEVNTHYDRCTECWRCFQEVHMEILDVTGPEEMEFQKIEFDHIENEFLLGVARFKSALKAFRPKQEDDYESAESKIDGGRQHGGLRVPYFKINQFAGDYDAWPAFKDLFRSLIHLNGQMSSVQKLGYLKVNLTGEALKIIKNLEITDANYETAWNLLVDRYDNERILVNRWMHLIVSIPSSKGEAEDIKKILDGTQEALQGLKNLGRPVDKYDDFLVYITETKLDTNSKQKWEDDIADDDNTAPTWDKMVTFLKTRFRSLEVSSKKSTFNSEKSINKSNSGQVVKSFLVEQSTKASKGIGCIYCKKNHRINFCFLFQKKSVKERQVFVNDKKLCANCLNPDHILSACPSNYTCRICHQRHNTVLHPDLTSSVVSSVGSNFSMGQLFRQNQNSTVLLATALIHVEVRGITVKLRALIDQGSQVSFITSSAVNRLRIRPKLGGPSIRTVGSDIIQRSKGMATFEFSSQFDPNCKFELIAAVLDNITQHLPSQYIDIRLPESWKFLNLADHTFYEPGPINVLLGADIFNEIIEEGLLKLNSHGIIAQNSSLGWFLSGKVKLSNPVPSTVNYVSADYTEGGIDRQLQTFWEIEEVTLPRRMDADDQMCDDYYNESHVRNQDGRFVVRLPFKPGFGQSFVLGNSRNIAVNSWLRMENRLDKSPDLRMKYVDMMNKLLENNYLEKIPEAELTISPEKSCYLPHHMVTRTGKNRIVFNASQKTSSGLSLNDVLLSGPPLQNDLFDILLHVRQFLVAFSADIVKMFRQFLINRLDVDYQRIVWRETKSDNVQDFRLVTVLDGTSSAPYLAIKTVQTLASKERSNFPQACAIIERDMYMDDLLSGAHDVESGLIIQNQLISLFQSAGMELRKWSSNKEELLQSLPDEYHENSVMFGKEDVIKTLGVYWSPKTDTFGYRINMDGQSEMTKRSLLSEASRLFDPAGWVSPCIIIPKMLFQSVWLHKLDWDDSLPPEVKRKWFEFRQQLPYLEKVKIPRWTGNSKSKRHGFLKVEELDKALLYWIQVTQMINFGTEISCIESNINIPGKSPIFNLKPMLDQHKILRVGGRLNHSNLTFDEKHPIILPKKDLLTNLIIAHTHEQTLHGGIQLMINTLRHKYWILNVRSAVRNYVHKCNRCFRFSAKPAQQLMADLPIQRVIPSRPFSHSAVDYAGPIEIKMRKGPGRPIMFKGYISIFVCMATRAIHLELVGDQTSDAFVAAFKRFVSRRGKVSDVYSDNGTTFIGAVGILSESHNHALLNIEKEFAELIANDGTDWHFSPPKAPHFNGLAEAGVRSVKYHLRRILGVANLTYEELYTVLCQIECVLNSRPICSLTDDSSDLTALTPGHFLMGSAPLSIPEPSLLSINENRLSRWQLVQKLNQDFWKSWSSDYLTLMQQRPKWQRIESNMMVGQLVLIREDNLPPTKWLLARIVEVHKGSDGLIRAATVKTEHSTFKRPIVKLCLLPSNQIGLWSSDDDQSPLN